ncbi:MAG: hypothetical protein KC438_08385, partial [Thermomicrobiales bacterium]|nr:hypothetical protein [Thermomicrobiales bacterium]
MDVGTGEAAVLFRTPPGAVASHRRSDWSLAQQGRELFLSVEARDFAHPAERDLARILSFYGIRWV